MASGNWRYTGEGIKFGPDGTLLDGQTRLRAIVLSGVTITMPVWRGIDPDAQLVMDSGRPRSNSDALSMPARRIVSGMKTITKPFIAIGRFTRQIVDEIRKVVTPSVREWAGWIVGVFVFVLLLMALVTGMDFGLGKLVLHIFG